MLCINPRRHINKACIKFEKITRFLNLRPEWQDINYCRQKNRCNFGFEFKMIRIIIISIIAGILSIFDIEGLIRNGGMIIVWLVVYASTGLFFCFFLPVGAVLFVTGVLSATGDLTYNIFFICSLLIPAAILGNLTGYWFGWKAGPLLHKRKDSKLFKQRHLKTADLF